MNHINQKEFIRLRKKIHYILRQFSPKVTPEQIEDCQQSVIASYLNESPPRNLRYLVVDYLRESSGRKDSVNYEKRMRLNSPTNPHLINRAFTTESVDNKIDLNIFVSRLNPFYQTLIRYYLMGYTHAEMGQLLGRTEGAIRTQFYEMNKKISKMKLN